ncbi:DNA recombination protein RmuC, partial [Haemophilus influenzae]
MSENLLLFSLLAVVIILILLLILRQQKYTHLHQELSKTTQDYNQLASKFDELSSIKNQFEQQTIKVQTENQGLQYRLTERDEQIHHLTQERQNLTEKLTALSQELTGLQTTLTEKEKYFSAQQQNFEQSKLQLSVEFQNLANRILDEKSRSFSQSNQTALETLLKPFREQIEGFQKRVNEIHSESVKGNAGLEAEIKKVLEIGLNMSQEASNLTSALKGEKKTLGNWGEVQLERALQLAGLEENVHYRAQAHFKDEQGGRNYPDFVLNLPDEKHLIIDSKMSLVAYESAVNSEDDFERERLLKEHISALKTHINDLHKKDYSNLIGMRSPNFVLMFIAVEPAYIEALKADPALFNYGYERNVIMVSHTTLMPILRTVANLWRIERGNAEAKEIAEKAGEIYNQICLVAERLNKLGNTLSTVSNQYNSTVTALVGQQGLVGKVERFKTLSA